MRKPSYKGALPSPFGHPPRRPFLRVPEVRSLNLSSFQRERCFIRHVTPGRQEAESRRRDSDYYYYRWIYTPLVLLSLCNCRAKRYRANDEIVSDYMRAAGPAILFIILFLRDLRYRIFARGRSTLTRVSTIL